MRDLGALEGVHEQALPIQREIGDRGGQATTLNNIGSVYNGLVDQQQALTYYEQAPPIQQEPGGCELDRAVVELEQAVDLDRQVGHPDLESDTATLNQVRREQQQGGSATGAGPT